MAADQDLKIEEGGDAKPKSKLKLIIIIVVALLLLGGGGGAAWFFFLKEEEPPAEVDPAAAAAAEEEKKKAEQAAEPQIPAEYIILKPEFVVSFQVGTRQRFLQTSIEIMSRKKTVSEAVALHEPMIRNEIIRILGEQDFDRLRTNDGRIALQDALQKQLGLVLSREANLKPEDIEAVLFTNFVMQ